MEEMKIIWVIMCVVCTVGILSQILLVHIMQEMHKGNALTRQIKLKFATCRKLDIQINNTDAFVEKMMDNYRKFGMSLRMIACIVDVMAYVCILLGLFGMYLMRSSVPELVMIAGLSVACFCMLRVTAILVDGREGVWRLKVELVDSLENYSRNLSTDLAEEIKCIEKEEPIAQKHFSKEAESEFNKMNKSFEKIMQERGREKNREEAGQAVGKEEQRKQEQESVIMEVLEEYLS